MSNYSICKIIVAVLLGFANVSCSKVTKVDNLSYYSQNELSATQGAILSNNNNKANGLGDNSFNIGWQLVPVYNSVTANGIGGYETAYIKEINNQANIYPLVWRQNPDIKRDPTEGEIGFVLPLSNYRAIWLDSFMLENEQLVFVKLINEEGRQFIWIYNLINGRPEQIFSLQNLDEISLSLRGEISTEAFKGDSLEQQNYRYRAGKFELFDSRIRQQNNSSIGRELTTLQGLSVGDQELFLRGPWLRSNEQSTNGPVILEFKPDSREVIFSQTGMTEIFDWRTSTRTYRGLLLDTRNSQISEIINNISVTYNNLNEIELRFTGDSVWSGLYHVMSLYEQESSFSLNRQLNFSNPNAINGSYKAISGEEYQFNYPNFSLINQNGAYEQGFYTAFTINAQTIASFQFINNQGLVTGRKNYLIHYNEYNEGNRMVRRLQLEPGNLIVWGIELNNEGGLYLEQIEGIN